MGGAVRSSRDAHQINTHTHTLTQTYKQYTLSPVKWTVLSSEPSEWRLVVLCRGTPRFSQTVQIEALVATDIAIHTAESNRIDATALGERGSRPAA